MELNELDCYIETYNKEIKSRIEKGDYNDELIIYMTGLVAVLSEECIRSSITRVLNHHSLQADFYAGLLLDNLKRDEKDSESIDKYNKELEVHLRQYRMRLEAKEK